LNYQKLPLKKKVKKKVPSTRSFFTIKTKQSFYLSKKLSYIYFLQKKMILGNGVKWNLKKDYEKSKLLQLKFFK